MATDQEVNTGTSERQGLGAEAGVRARALGEPHGCGAQLSGPHRTMGAPSRSDAGKLASGACSGPNAPLDLTWAELDEVVTKVVIDQHPDPKRRRQLGRLWHDVDQLHKQSTPLKLTSWLIAAGLIVLAALNILDFAVLKDLSPSFVLGMNLGAVFMVSCFWALASFWHAASTRRRCRRTYHVRARTERVKVVIRRRAFHSIAPNDPSVRPPSTTSTCPVVKSLAGEAR